jgi:signal transduction histidine kinase/CheY-like chemotaxis protein
MHPMRPMQSIVLGKRLIFAFSVGLFCVVLVGVNSLFAVEDFRSLIFDRGRSDQILSSLSSVEMSLMGLESGVRGYALTGLSENAAAFDRGSSLLPTELDHLGQLIKQEDWKQDLFEEIKTLSQRKLELSSMIYTRLRSKNPPSKTEITEMIKRGRQIINRITIAIGKMRTYEEIALLARQEKLAETTLSVRLTSSLGTILSFFLVLFAFGLTNKDTARRMETEEKLRQATEQALEASASKSRFLANMSHEIRTPMNGVLGMADLISRTSLNPEQMKYVETIGRSSRSLLSVINEILDIAKIESGKLEIEHTYFEIRDVVEDAIQSVRYGIESKGLKLELEIDPEIPPALSGDPTRIRQILINLLGNASKFSEQGSIILRVGFEPATYSRRLFIFEIQDQGIGIAHETLSSLFEPFTQADQSTTRKYGGTGLGLSITKQLVDLMGGSIDVRSEIGKGSTFRVSLPLEPVQQIQISEQVGSNIILNQSSPLHVLVVEDNSVNWEVFRLMLKRIGHTSDLAENGLDALKKISERQYDLVLMDCHMPIMDGYTATAELRKLPGAMAQIPIIAVTANAIKGDMINCLKSGMNDYISKPMATEDLAMKIALWTPKKDPPSPAVLDQKALASMREIDPDGSEDLLGKLAAAYIKAGPSVTQIAELRMTGDFKPMSETAHKLKSTAANVGLSRVKSLCQKIEDLKSTNGEDELNTLEFHVNWLKSEYELGVRHLWRGGIIKENVFASLEAGSVVNLKTGT